MRNFPDVIKRFLNAPNLEQPGIALYLAPPSLIVDQMSVQNIEFMLCQQFDIPADLWYREKVADNVKMHAAPAEFQSVLHLQTRYTLCRKFDPANNVYFRRQQLA